MPELPQEWELKRLRDATLPGRDGFIDGDWIEAPYITDAGVRLIQTGNIGVGSFIDKPETRKYISAASYRILNCTSVNAGDILICRLADPIGRACEVPANVGDAVTAVDCTITRVDQSRYNKSFLLHWLNSDHNLKAAADMAAGSTRSRISRSNLGRLPLPRPPLNEQMAVGKVLDTVDTTIRQTEAIIEKLKQIKQGLLHDLLTRGIDTNGELRPPQSQAPHLYKDSPLGWIPNSWEIKRGRDVCNEIIVGIVVRPTQYYRASGVTVLRSANVREEGLALENAVFMSNRDHQNQQKSAVRPGDVLTVRTGYPGTSCVVDEQVAEANCVDIIISRPNANTNPHFWAMWINSSFGKEQVLRVQGGLAQQHFNVGELAAMWVAMPSSSEQDAIVERVRAMNMRRSAEERSAALHRDMKSGLMDDLLTGRVRVTALLNAIP